MSAASLDNCIASLDGTTFDEKKVVTLDKTIAVQSKEGEFMQMPVAIVNEIPFFKACYETILNSSDEKAFIPSGISMYSVEALDSFYRLSYDAKAQNFNYHAIDDMNARLRCNDLRKSSKRWHYVLPDWNGYTLQAKLDRERDPSEPEWSGYNEEQRAKRRACLASGEDIRTPLPIDYSGFRGISEEMNTWLLTIPPEKILEVLSETSKVMDTYLTKLLQARVVCYVRECVKEDEFEGVKYTGEKDRKRLDIIRERMRIRELRTWEPPKEVKSDEERDLMDILFEI